MTTGSKIIVSHRNSSESSLGYLFQRAMPAVAALGFGLSFFLAGCQAPETSAAAAPAQTATKSSDMQTVREGDVLKISFPGAPNLDTSQTVRRDGRISLGVVGEIKAAGLTPADLEKQLVQLYASQLVEKEVTVTVVSSSFSVYVTGAVIKPGKVTTDHPITILDAIMEAGGFDNTKADPKAVVIIRVEDGRTKRSTINVRDIINGLNTEPIYLKPLDTVIVNERFSLFN
jgi:polysaccharide export outer membrane protein